jgi:hypothetical protein
MNEQSSSEASSKTYQIGEEVIGTYLNEGASTVFVFFA